MSERSKDHAACWHEFSRILSQVLKSADFATTARAIALPLDADVVLPEVSLTVRATTRNEDFTGNVDAVSGYCSAVDSANNDWHWKMAGGVWGTGTGTFGQANGKMCVLTSNSAGGAIYIGPSANPGPGSAKLECYFPTPGTANCDISLVDGYSLSMTCGGGGVPQFGGGGDLFTQNACPDSQGVNCINTQGYAAAQSDVDKFFQYGVQGGNKYCIWVDCAEDYYFDVTASMGCYITGF